MVLVGVRKLSEIGEWDFKESGLRDRRGKKRCVKRVGWDISM